MEKKIKKKKEMNDKKLECHPVCARGMEFAPGLVGSRVADAPSYGSFLVLVS